LLPLPFLISLHFYYTQDSNGNSRLVEVPKDSRYHIALMAISIVGFIGLYISADRIVKNQRKNNLDN